MKYTKIKYNNEYYCVFEINYKQKKLPVIVNWKDFICVYYLNKCWKLNSNYAVSCEHEYQGILKTVCLHTLILALTGKDKEYSNNPIIHINRIKLDNRRDNLMYDRKDNAENKNGKKKKRRTVIPNTNINPDDIPTYVFYMKEDKGHGDRFMVRIGNICWKTTSSKKISTEDKYKLALEYVEELKIKNPDIFKKYCINGEYNNNGKYLEKTYYEIIKKAGYDDKNVL